MSCIDCLAAGRPGTRPAPYPGPRCATDHRAVRQARSAVAHARRVQRVYGLGEGDYDRLYAAQGGRCAILGCPATGARKRLAVDHDHSTGEVRGLLCGPHNQDIGRYGDSPERFESVAAYLRNPPARQTLRGEQAA